MSEYIPADGFWSMDTWGESLVATSENAPVYIWQKSLGVLNVMQVIEAAPAKNLLIVVSPVDQHMLLLGTVPEGQTSIDPMYVRWCDQGNYNEWETTATNTAGGFRLTRGNKIVARIQSGQNTLVWTNTSIYRIWYTGPPRTFGKQPIAEVGIIGQNAAIDYRGTAYWMTERGFYMYNGRVGNLESSVRSFVFDYLDKDNMEKSFAGVNKRHDEVWWFFPSTHPDVPLDDNTGLPAFPDECNAYVAYDTVENTWHMGFMFRSAWMGTSAFNHWPYAVAQDGSLLDHERGTTANGILMGEFLESYELDLPSGSGGMKTLVKAYVPDFPVLEGKNPSLKVTLKGRGWSQESEGPVKEMTVTQDQKIIKARLRGRQIAIRIDGVNRTTDWRMATPRLDLQLDGER